MSTLTGSLQRKVKKSSKKPLQWLRRAAFERRAGHDGPFGERDILPCDFHQSGGSLKIIEKFVTEMVEPQIQKDMDGSVLAKKRLIDTREEARRFIHKATNCSEDHVVLFTESGSFLDVFMSYMHALDVPRLCQEGRRPPLILLGHDLWGLLHLETRKLGAETSEIQIGSGGRYDLKKMEALLKFYKKQERAVIGAFSVGDEITGVLSDLQQMTALLHQYGALAIWDYSSAGAYTKIDMCPLLSYGGLTNKDAAYIKTERFLGGYEASGVFITSFNVLRNPMFETGIEGILSFSCVEGSLERSTASHSTSNFNSTRMTRQAFVSGPLRARCAFELKGYFGDCYLQKRTLEISTKLSQGLISHRTIHVVGGAPVGSSLPYVSLLFFHPHTEWALHHGFVLAVLQDVFGIVATQHSIGVQHLPETPQLESQRSMHAILSNEQDVQFASERIMHVNAVHVSLMYFMRDVDLDFLSAAIIRVADEGWRLLPFYRFNVATGKWILPHNMTGKTERMGSTLAKLRAVQSSAQSVRYRHVAYLERANKLLNSITDQTVRKTLKNIEPQGDEGLSPAAKEARWFMTPAEATELLDEASPVRISKNTTADRTGDRRRTWHGSSHATNTISSNSLRIRKYSFRRKIP